MQRLAFFDLDNTLIDRQNALSGWVNEFCISRDLSDSACIKMCEELSVRAYPADFVRLRRELQLAESADELWKSYVRGIAARVTCRPGTAQRLGELRAAGWSLGVITNGAVDIQQAKLKQTGLLGAFDMVCISGEVGVRKPSPEIFEAAARRCALPLDGWMVGDNPATDVGGGQAVGLRTLWISGGREWPAGARNPDSIAEDASAAITYLLEWGYGRQPQSSGIL
ncbi:HAD family hydrolase [Streptomyces albireticuli]|uniref:HAD family hydrolase n=1 Tax=Streptomyces albireticuli TaxID=1940 RepID=UPI0014738F52|nr:HAD-IA family hydrolase [Streptomyces albireticuli]MCD9142392.1 HAD-IA family hydrolase [Streptomyces albireticuli]MCD9166037.1 HAD-IA family hydrolase [Streptomyces albireticuli]MCD9192520.1 HAD-IA family hydrolase [Streptomyces albireticuli]